MTLTLELPSQLESRLTELAAADGATVEAIALKVLSVGVSMDAPAQSTLSPRPQKVLRGYGKYAGMLPTVDEFLAERHAEARREAEKDERRGQSQAAHEAAA
jgi:hypothetical protein